MLIYVAGQISNGGTLPPEQIAANRETAMMFGTAIVYRGHQVIIPHLNAMWDAYLKVQNIVWNTDDWLVNDLAIVARCNALFRIQNGPSRGSDTEEQFAKAHQIPVFYTLDSIPKLTLRVSKKQNPC